MTTYAQDVSLPLRTILNANPAWNRGDLGDLTELEGSIRLRGLVLPVLVTPDAQVIDGARRVEVLRQLERPSVPVKMANTWQDVVDYFIEARKQEADGLPFKPLGLMEFGALVSEVLAPMMKRDSGMRAAQSRRRPGATEPGVRKTKVTSAANTVYASMFGLGLSSVIVRRDIWSKTQTCKRLGLGDEAEALVRAVEARDGRLHSLQAALADLSNGRPIGRRNFFKDDEGSVSTPAALIVDTSPNPRVAATQTSKIKELLFQLRLIGDEVQSLGPLNQGIEPETADELFKLYRSAMRKVAPLRGQLLEIGTPQVKDNYS